MLKSRSYLRSLLSFSSTNYYQNSHHCGCTSLMSPTTSAAMAASAPSFTSPQRDNFSYMAALSSKNTTKINSIRLKGSSSDNHNINQNHDHCSSGSINGNRLQKARSYAPSLTPLLRCTEASNPSRVIDRGNGGPHQRGSLIGSSPKNGERFVVAVDVDEVLGNFVSALNQFIADRYSLNHSVSEYHVYEFFKIWNCSRNEADIRVHEFFKTSYFKKGIHPIPGAKEALQKLSRFCNLSIVTSRQNAIKDHTVEWIEKYYPGIFQEIHFGNHFALDGTSRPKSDICRSLGAHILIDDNPRYAIECANEGMKVLLFDFEDSYPWSKMESIDQHPLVTKVVNWKEVENQIASWVIT